jgi:hypothetical protein
MESIICPNGVDLRIGWSAGRGVRPENLPRKAGLYAQLYSPEGAIRVGHAQDLRGRNLAHRMWCVRMQDGTAPASQQRRKGVLALRVKRHKDDGLEYFVVSCDDIFQMSQQARLVSEAFLLGYVREKCTSESRPCYDGVTPQKLSHYYELGRERFSQT